MILQMMGRILRLSNEDNQKIYFKVATKNTAGYFVDLMTAALCLFKMEWYSQFNGKNMGGILIPKVKTTRPKTKGKSTPTNKKKQTQRIATLEELGIPLDLNLFNQSILYSHGDKFSTVAWTTLDECRREFFRTGKSYTKDELYDMVKDAKRVADIKNGQGNQLCDINAFKTLCVSSGNWYGYNGEQYFLEITKHISNQKECKWNIQLAKKEVKKYNKISEIQKDNNSLYKWIRDNNLADELYSHMNRRIDWTEDRIMEEALKHSKKVDFQKAPNSAYKAAKRLGIVDKVCAHMEQNKRWSIKEVKQLQKGFIYDIDFRRAHPQAYNAACRFGLRLKMK
jgi:hypothetical protein